MSADAALADKVTPRRQHSAPEYLERRKQERERRKSETGLRYRLRRNRKSDADTIAEVCALAKALADPVGGYGWPRCRALPASLHYNQYGFSYLFDLPGKWNENETGCGYGGCDHLLVSPVAVCYAVGPARLEQQPRGRERRLNT